MSNVDDAFIHRHAGAEREHEHGDDEAPEIELAAVTERVQLVGGAFRLTAAPHQQQLVDRIYHAVNALGQHRRGTGDRGCDELRYRNAKVRGERDHERPRAGRMRAHLSQSGRNAANAAISHAHAREDMGWSAPPRKRMAYATRVMRAAHRTVAGL